MTLEDALRLSALDVGLEKLVTIITTRILRRREDRSHGIMGQFSEIERTLRHCFQYKSAFKTPMPLPARAGAGHLSAVSACTYWVNQD